MHDRVMTNNEVYELMDNLVHDSEMIFYLYHNYRVTIKKILNNHIYEVQTYSCDKYYVPFFCEIDKYSLIDVSIVNTAKKQVSFNI